jgi:tetratricopeptide (TPR) repeat protein
MQLGQYENSLKDINKLIELEPESAIYRYRKAKLFENFPSTNANVYYQRKTHIEDNYNKAIELNPQFYYAYLNRGQHFRQFEQYEKAIQDYNKAIEIDPQLPVPFYYRAGVFVALKQYAAALDNYNMSMKLYKNKWQTDSYEAYIGRGILYGKMLDIENAEKDFNIAISLYPEYAGSYYERALCYTELKYYEKAEDDFNTAVDLDTNSADSYFYRVKYYVRTNKFDKAILDCNKIIQIDSKDPEPYYCLGLISDLKNEGFVALRYFDKSITLFSTDARYYINNLDFSARIELHDLYIRRASVFQKMNQNKLMCEDYQKACELGDCEMFNAHCK